MAEFLFSVGFIVLTGLALGLGTLLGRGPLRRGCCRRARVGACGDADSCGSFARAGGGPTGTTNPSIRPEDAR